jgi:hypothetical protein
MQISVILAAEENRKLRRAHVSLIRCHARLLPNLGCYSSQRVESFHPLLKQVLHGHLNLETAVRNIGGQVAVVLRDLSTEEDQSRIQRPQLADQFAFSTLFGSITHKAILLMANK